MVDGLLPDRDDLFADILREIEQVEQRTNAAVAALAALIEQCTDTGSVPVEALQRVSNLLAGRLPDGGDQR